MHIVILADPIDNQRAGVYVYTKNLIEQLLKFDKKNKYSFIHERKNVFFNKTNNYIIPKKNRPGYGTYRKFFLIPKLIKKLKPDIVFEPCHIGPFHTPPSAKRVVMIHDLSPILFPEFHIKRSTIIHKLLLKRALRSSDLILTASEKTKQDIQKYCKTKAKIAVIPLGIFQPKNNLHTQKSTTKFKKFPYFLYLGTIEPRKNLATLIDIFEDLKKAHKIPHKLIIAGEIGWHSKKILKKIRKNKDIILTGHISEKQKSDYYKNADIFIYPSIYEGFGLPPLEAISYGTPVICSDGGSLKEIFKNHALLFAPNDKETLKKHILTLLKNKRLRKKLIIAGKNYSKNFTWQKTAKKTLSEFLKLG